MLALSAHHGQSQWLALVGDAFGGHGGIAQYNRDLMSAVAASGYASSICVLPRHAPRPAAPPAGITQVTPRGRARYAVGALSFALSKSFDVVFCGHIHLLPLAALIARTRRAKLILQAHGIEVWSQPKGICRAAFEHCDLVLCVSRYTRRTIIDQTMVTPERVLVLSNTVGEAFTPGDSFDFRRKHGLENKRVLLTVGRMDSRERYKGQDRVIAALPDLLAQDHDLIYLVVGEGDDRSRLEHLARQARVGDRVRFLGALETDSLVEVYRAADLFVMPSTGEGFGISFLEAMACGTPALGLAARGTSDALADGALGIVVAESELPQAVHQALLSPRKDPAALAAAVRARFGRDLFEDSVNAVLKRLYHAGSKFGPAASPAYQS